MITILFEDWVKAAKQLYGDDAKKWKFKCANCGHVQCAEDFKKLGMTSEEISGVVHFSCIGRWMKGTQGTLGNKKQPCDYTLGGLLPLNTIQVKRDDDIFKVFEFADDFDYKSIEYKS